ncbi:hypothetical protein [Pseudomonas viridiflava]|uniref:hypothetical protein n=2 Tax=Pseudomonas TaxID=286 RepID=UPI000F0351DB|nr:hypothetical protein [Pseudomonas viridiflava]
MPRLAPTWAFDMQALPLYQKQMMWRMDDARELLSSGIDANNTVMVSGALDAYKEVKAQAVDNELTELVSQIGQDIHEAMWMKAVIKKVVQGKIAADILEMLLGHVNLSILDLQHVNLEQMSARTSTLLADSLIRFYDKGHFEYGRILNLFADKKYREDWKRLYAHMLHASLDVDIDKYRCDHFYGELNLFSVVNANQDTELTTPIYEVLIDNQDDVLKHLLMHKLITDSAKASPLNVLTLIGLYERGFTQPAEMAGDDLFSESKYPRQMVLAQRAGMVVDKQLVIDKLMFTAYGRQEKPEAWRCARMDTDALVYVLESESFDLDDLKALKAKVKGSRSKLSQTLSQRVACDLSIALKAVYDHQRDETSDLLIRKTEFLVDWGLKSTVSTYRNALRSALIELHFMPKHIVFSHQSLQDARFGCDLGL